MVRDLVSFRIILVIFIIYKINMDVLRNFYSFKFVNNFELSFQTCLLIIKLLYAYIVFYLFFK